MEHMSVEDAIKWSEEEFHPEDFPELKGLI